MRFLKQSACPNHGASSAPSSATRAHEVGKTLTLNSSDLGITSSDEARAFLLSLAAETGEHSSLWMERWSQVEKEFRLRGAYEKTVEELTHAARIAWRNSIRCIGRQHWRSLTIRDQRHICTPDEVFGSILEHMKSATDSGAVKPLMTIFTRDTSGPHPLRILNHQIIRYAGYRSQGHCLGDPANAGITDLAFDLGWKPPTTRTPFDVLPIIISDRQGNLHMYSLPDDPNVVREIRITHPDFPWFEKLNMKWHAVPAISDMVLDAGGLKYPANIFNGWYMSTEIACRNLGDTQRYDFLPLIAERMGLNQRSDRTLWRDRALIELNAAVLHSFDQAGVRMVDHHAASKQFMDFSAREQQQREGRETFGDWSWLVPPISSSTSPIFHHSFAENVVKPGLFYLGSTPA